MAVIEREVSEEKKKVVKEIQQKVEESSLVVLSEYRGLSVSALTELRRNLREAGADAKVYKNTLTRIAFGDLKIAYPESLLTGPNLLVNTNGDVAAVSKVLVQFRKDNEQLSIKGGVLDNQLLSLKGVEELSKLPSRDVLIAQVIGQIKAPLSGLVRSLSSPQSGLVAVLKQIENKKSEE